MVLLQLFQALVLRMLVVVVELVTIQLLEELRELVVLVAVAQQLLPLALLDCTVLVELLILAVAVVQVGLKIAQTKLVAAVAVLAS